MALVNPHITEPGMQAAIEMFSISRLKKRVNALADKSCRHSSVRTLYVIVTICDHASINQPYAAKV